MNQARHLKILKYSFIHHFTYMLLKYWSLTVIYRMLEIIGYGYVYCECFFISHIRQLHEYIFLFWIEIFKKKYFILCVIYEMIGTKNCCGSSFGISYSFLLVFTFFPEHYILYPEIKNYRVFYLSYGNSDQLQTKNWGCYYWDSTMLEKLQF